MYTLTLQHAQRLWDYMASFRSRESSDLIVVCCSYDLRVGDYATELLKAGVADKILLSGNTGNWTRHLWSKPEAHVFRERAIRNGTDASVILIEDQAENFGDNIAKARAMAPWAKRVTFLTKPNSVLRVSLTVPVQWPEVIAFVDSPVIQFPQEVSNVVGILGVIDEMVGDMQRIIEYPKVGFQVKHDFPQEVLDSWHYLIDQGFTNHLLTKPH